MQPRAERGERGQVNGFLFLFTIRSVAFARFFYHFVLVLCFSACVRARPDLPVRFIGYDFPPMLFSFNLSLFFFFFVLVYAACCWILCLRSLYVFTALYLSWAALVAASVRHGKLLPSVIRSHQSHDHSRWLSLSFAPFSGLVCYDAPSIHSEALLVAFLDSFCSSSELRPEGRGCVFGGASIYSSLVKLTSVLPHFQRFSAVSSDTLLCMADL